MVKKARTMKRIDERLRTHYSTLSPQEQRLAECIFQHLDDLISYNSAELADLSNVSKATVSRLFRRLGYVGYKDVRDELRTLRQSGLPVADSRAAVQGNTLLERHYQQELDNLVSWTQAIDQRQFDHIITALHEARRIRLVGLRNSYPVALHLRQQLIHIRPHITMLAQPGQTLSEELADPQPGDVMIVVAFRRRPRVIKPLLAQLQQQNVPVLLLCEPQARHLAPLARWTLHAPLDSISAFDSYGAAMGLVNLICNALLHHMLSDGRERIHQIADIYHALDELE